MFRLPTRLLIPLLPIGAAIFLAAASRPPDIPFQIRMIDGGASETVAVADLNNDGRPDIISGESWYEAPNWVKHPLRPIEFNNNSVDDFTDIALDGDGDGWIDVIQFGYFSNKIVWLKNPRKTGAPWAVNEIDASGPTEFAFLVDLNNDGKAQELLPEFDRPNVPLAWFELQNGKWIKHVVSKQTYGHGIGVGDLQRRQGAGAAPRVRPPQRSPGMVRITERQVDQACRQQADLRPRHRRGRYQRRRTQRHPHAPRLAGSARRCPRPRGVEVPSHRLGSAPHRARRRSTPRGKPRQVRLHVRHRHQPGRPHGRAHHLRARLRPDVVRADR